MQQTRGFSQFDCWNSTFYAPVETYFIETQHMKWTFAQGHNKFKNANSLNPSALVHYLISITRK